MRKALYFPKPQPLSPKSKTWVEGNTRYRKNKTAKGGKTSVKGVPTTDSIYYLWFEYLKRSEKYKTACANNGKGMTKLYKDFGNVFEYVGVEGFWTWWNKRGQYLFGIEGKQEILEFDNADEVVSYEDYKLIAIPKNITATTIKKRLNKLVDDMELNPTSEQKAKYSIAQTKVDVESLKTCLMAHELKQQGIGVLEIGLQVKWVSSAEAKDLIEDNRSKGKEVDLEKLVELSEKNYMEYNRLISKAQAVLRKRLKDKYIDADDEDDLMDKEMRIYKVDYVRTTRKKSIRTNTHKLINKAKANIEAVEKGVFGVGHLCYCR
jgi:hypothetical protein